MATEEIVLEGHIIDSLTLPRVMDAIVYQNGDFEVVEIRVGRTRDAKSYARLKVTAPDAILAMIAAAASVHSAEPVLAYIVSLVHATRRAPGVRLGSSPRGSHALMGGARVRAASKGRHYVIPEDVASLVPNVLGHRIVLSPDAVAAGRTVEQVLGEVLATVPVPQG